MTLGLAKMITEGHDALDDISIKGLLAQLNGSLALGSQAVKCYKAEPIRAGAYQIVQFSKPTRSNVGKFDIKREAEEDAKKPKVNATQRFSSYENARNAALKWLEDYGFKAEKPNLAKMRLDPNFGKPVGMTDSTGKIGFRIEYGLVDGEMAPHINVFDMTQPKRLQDGPHFEFPGTQESVNAITKNFYR